LSLPDDRWPALSYNTWNDTYATLHMWSQVVGKIALATAAPVNHSWGVALRVTSRGLSTGLLAHDVRAFSIEFDFLDQLLRIGVSNGDTRTLPLAPRSVARFYGEVMALLAGLSLPVTIWPVPVEVPSPIRFDRDEQHRSYDPEHATRFWRLLVQIERVFAASRARFVGKCSPIHFFWGGFDLAVTRFSGRPAPPREGPAFMREAYSHEVISHGFWPGSGPVLEPAFYAYAVPQPEGLPKARIRPGAAYYHSELGEFILPYEAVRTSPAPARAIAEFVDSTYDAAATLGGWDRAALERR
jgi:Family of unknown function (DUF5996)